MTSTPGARTSILWFRDDLRLHDHPALTAATSDGPVIPIYIRESGSGIRPLGGAAKWWADRSLASLETALSKRGAPLIFLSGDPRELVPRLAEEFAASSVHVSGRFGQLRRDVDVPLRSTLNERGIAFVEHDGALIEPPNSIRTAEGERYSVFTPYWRKLSETLDVSPPRLPLPAPETIPVPASLPTSEHRSDWHWQPSHPDWSAGLAERWTPGEDTALHVLATFVDEELDGYEDARNDLPGSGSELSPRLRWGELSPVQVWHRAAEANAPSAAFLRQLGWREFSYHLVEAFPQMATVSWRPSFEEFPWEWDRDGALPHWQMGDTGVDLVDAGMLELWKSGFMHNRARMVTASYLTKNLLLHWRLGEEWFWDTLVDADPAVNAVSWQWVAGSGADAAPYFRVFNPVRQQERFDPERRYIAKWLGNAGLRPPPPSDDDLKAQRQRALDAYQTMKDRTA